jgi:hypothetical protein
VIAWSRMGCVGNSMWRRSSVRISVPEHWDMGLSTKFPLRVGWSPKPQKTWMSAGWSMKWGWCGTTILMSQLLSFKVIRAPVPGAFWVHAVMRSMSSGELRVTVKDSHWDSGMRVEKLEGLPKRALSWERDSHRVQEGSVDGGDDGAVVLVPREEDAVIEPRVTRTMSLSWT